LPRTASELRADWQAEACPTKAAQHVWPDVHRVDLVNHSTPHAASGVNATATVTGEYPWASMTAPMAGPSTVEIAP
jgi:hypothetical protein